MKSLVFVGIFSVLIASIYASDSSIPAFFWSGKNYFSGKNVEVLDNINALDVESSFDQITKSPSTNNLVEASALQSFINTGANTKPEVVVLFVASKLRVDQITRFSGANDADNTGGAFSNLKDAISASSSSLVVPYTSEEAFAEPLAEHLAARAGRVIVAQKGNYFLSNLRNKKNVKFISLEQLSGLTAENIFNNGVTDVVVVAMDTDNSLRSFQAADEIVGQVEDLVAKATAGNYVAVFTGRTAEAPKVAQPVLPRRRVADINNGTNPYIDDSDFWRYFPYQIWEVIVVSIPLLLILATGLTCLCMVQTPDKFEGGIRGRQ